MGAVTSTSAKQLFPKLASLAVSSASVGKIVDKLSKQRSKTVCAGFAGPYCQYFTGGLCPGTTSTSDIQQYMVDDGYTGAGATQAQMDAADQRCLQHCDTYLAANPGVVNPVYVLKPWFSIPVPQCIPQCIPHMAYMAYQVSVHATFRHCCQCDGF